MATMATMASLQRGMVGSLQLLSSSKDGEVFGSRSELSRACGPNLKLGSWSFSRQSGVFWRPRAQEDDFPPSEPMRQAGNDGERYASTNVRDIWRKGDSPLVGRGAGRGSASKTPNSSSRTFGPRESSPKFVSDGNSTLAPWEQGPGSPKGGTGMRVRPRGRNPLIERLKKMQAEIAKDEADRLALVAAAIARGEEVKPEVDRWGPNSEVDRWAPSSEGEGLVPDLDRGLRDFDDEGCLDGIREDSAVASLVAGNGGQPETSGLEI